MSGSSSELKRLAAQTQQIYQRNAVRFDVERSKTLFEKAWLDRFAKLLPSGAAVLDAGCGAGDPIAAYLSGLGFRVTGIDAAAAMIALAKSKYPHGDWRQADMRRLDLEERFDGIIGWNSFFHLTPEEQRSTLPLLAAHLAPSGVLMLTVGPGAGEVSGHVGDDPVYHSSLARAEYETILASLGLEILRFVPEDPACNFHTVLLARMRL